MLRYLFEVLKINVDEQYGQDRQTALHEAIIQGSLLGLVDNKIVSTILEFTPSLAIKNNKGLTPLALADSYHSHAGNAKHLIEQHQEALNNSNAQSPGMKH